MHECNEIKKFFFNESCFIRSTEMVIRRIGKTLFRPKSWIDKRFIFNVIYGNGMRMRKNLLIWERME